MCDPIHLTCVPYHPKPLPPQTITHTQKGPSLAHTPTAPTTPDYPNHRSHREDFGLKDVNMGVDMGSRIAIASTDPNRPNHP